jgi:hypothetical protein
MTAATFLDAFVLAEQAEHDSAEDDLGPSATALVVARWHDDNHSGAFPTCQESLCAAVRRVDGR